MRKGTLMRAAVLAVALVAACAAADVTGKWKATMEGGGGPGEDMVFTFKQEGTKLTGVVSGGPMGEMPITEGKVEGNNISFVLSMDGDMKMLHEGTISGNEIKLKMKGGPGGVEGPGPMTITLRKISGP